jgi:hypothetical protein
MAVGAFLAFPHALFAGLVALILGGVLGLLSAIRLGRAGEILSRSLGIGRWLVHRASGIPLAKPATSGLRIPFGVAIALATVLIVLLPGLGGLR